MFSVVFQFLSSVVSMVYRHSGRLKGLQGVLFTGHPNKQGVVKRDVLQIDISCLLDPSQIDLMQPLWSMYLERFQAGLW